MSIKSKQLSPIGAEIDADIDTLLHDEDVPDEILELLEENGVLVFPELSLDDEQLVAFGRRLGDVIVKGPGSAGRDEEHPEVYEVSLDPESSSAVYTRATFNWHIDGTTDDIPTKASLLVGKVVTDAGGDTQFASTYAAYDDLSDDEKARFDDLQVIHHPEVAYRLVDPDPSPEALARLRRSEPRPHPLVWTHRTGRKSLVLGATASHVVGMPEAEGAAIVNDLLDRATEPSRVYSHKWSVGDLVIWDNRGVLHRALPYPEEAGREMHRVTLVGDEPIS